MFSSFGNNLKVMVYGGSHEPEIGVIIDGLPVGTEFDMEALQRFMDRRAPGNSPFATPRKEPDTVLPQDGLKIEGKTAVTTDRTVKLVIENTNTRSQDYRKLRDIPRPGHADYTAYMKYGSELNMAGGGPFSARMTAPLCIAGGIALQLLSRKGIEIGAHIYSVGNIYDAPLDPVNPQLPWKSEACYSTDCGIPDFPAINREAGEKMKNAILKVKEDGDSIGGIVEVFVKGLPE